MQDIIKIYIYIYFTNAFNVCIWLSAVVPSEVQGCRTHHKCIINNTLVIMYSRLYINTIYAFILYTSI